MRRAALTGLLVAGVSSVQMLTAPLAVADFHLVSIREVFPGSISQPDAEYVEFQAYTSGQNFIAGHSVTFRDKDGVVQKTETFNSDVSNGGNQMTFVMATPAAESRFGISADDEMAPNLIDPLGGAVCWESLDCVSWGNFTGTLPSPTGSPATPAGIPDEQALRRTIAPGCATLLEPSDDRDNSAVDFEVVFPNPRPNSVAPAEKSCGAQGGGGGQGVQGEGGGAPQTIIKRKPAKKSIDRTPTFRFVSDEAGSSFQCKVDGKKFKSCRSPLTTKKLSFGSHTFRVRAKDRSGQVDPTPATYRFKVLRPRQRT